MLFKNTRRYKSDPIYDPNPYKVMSKTGASVVLERDGKKLIRNSTFVKRCIGDSMPRAVKFQSFGRNEPRAVDENIDEAHTTDDEQNQSNEILSGTNALMEEIDEISKEIVTEVIKKATETIDKQNQHQPIVEIALEISMGVNENENGNDKPNDIDNSGDGYQNHPTIDRNLIE